MGMGSLEFPMRIWDSGSVIGVPPSSAKIKVVCFKNDNTIYKEDFVTLILQ